MSEPSKTMVKSWMVCRMRMRELTVMWSRRRALSSYIRVIAGHSANRGIHCGSRRSLQTQTETSPEHCCPAAELHTHWSCGQEGERLNGAKSSQALRSPERKSKSSRWILLVKKVMKQCTLRGKGNPSDSKSESAQIGHKDLDVVKIFSILILPLLKRSRTSFCIV